MLNNKYNFTLQKQNLSAKDKDFKYLLRNRQCSRKIIIFVHLTSVGIEMDAQIHRM